MGELILHHYEASMFSEKIRLILGWKGLAWQSVIIDPTVPRPRHLTLTGGYRRTPVLQVGADVFCDTGVICEWLDRTCPTPPLYPCGNEFTARAVAEWAETHLFQVCVTVSFQPRALEAALSSFTAEQIEQFQADRAHLAEAAVTGPLFTPATAEAYLIYHLQRLDAQMATRSMLFGDDATIADFSTYQCLWLVAGNAVTRTMLKPYEHVGAWMERVAACGHGDRTEIDAQSAIAQALDAEPADAAGDAEMLPTDTELGDMVTITPSDYGRVPVHGQLIGCNAYEYVILRDSGEVGQVAVHFPRAGIAIERH